MLGSRESGLDLLSNANSLFLLLLVFAQCLVLVVTIMSTQSVGLHCGKVPVVCWILIGLSFDKC